MARLSTKYGNVRELITGSAQYRVPRYQRRYKWRTSHEVLDIWEDILTRYVALVHPEEAADASDSHFLGALVIGQGDPPDPLGVTPYIVIDGQQRIMSLMLIASSASSLERLSMASRVHWSEFTIIWLSCSLMLSEMMLFFLWKGS